MEMAYAIYCMMIVGYRCFCGVNTISGGFGIKFYYDHKDRNSEGILIKRHVIDNSISIEYINEKNIPECTLEFYTYHFNRVINTLQYIIYDLQKTNIDKSCLKEAFKKLSNEDDIIHFTNEIKRQKEKEKY
jgi:hypothetical protein